MNRSHVLLSLLLALVPTARLHAAPGGLDPTFAAGAGKLRIGIPYGVDQCEALAVQPDGKTILVGPSMDGTDHDIALLRHNVDGTLDASFGTGGRVLTRLPHRTITAHAVKLQADGKIVIAGEFTESPGITHMLVARYTSAGVLDPGFGAGGLVVTSIGQWDFARGLGILSDGRIVVVGSANFSGDDYFAAVQYNSNGTPDASFGSQGIVTTNIQTANDIANAVAILDDNTIVLAGSSYSPSQMFNRFALVKYDANGNPDIGFSGDGIQATTITGQQDFGLAVAIQQGTPDKIVVAGTSGIGSLGGQSYSITRYNLNGSLDTSFDGDGRLNFLPLGRHGGASALAIQYDPDGTPRILVAGHTLNQFTHLEMTVVRRLASGAADNTFDGDGIATPTPPGEDALATAIQVTSTHVVAAGWSTPIYSSFTAFLETRCSLSGVPDTAFDGDGIRTDQIGQAGMNHAVVALQSDGKILLADRGTTSGGPFTVLRRLADGSPDPTFGSNGVAIGVLNITAGAGAILVQPDGRILVAAGPNGGCYVARYLTNGTLDQSFGNNGYGFTTPGYCLDISAMALQSNGGILLAGSSGDVMRVARLNPNGLPDSTFGFGGVATADDWPFAEASAIVVQPDGGIVIGGSGASGGFIFQFALARFNQYGLRDFSFGTAGTVTTPIGDGSKINGLLLQPDRKIVAVGTSTYGFGDNLTVARYDTAGVPDPSFGQSGIVVRDLIIGADRGFAVSRQNDGNLLVAGAMIPVYVDPLVFGIFPNPEFAVAAFLPNGAIDVSYGNNGFTSVDLGDFTEDVAYGIAIDPLQRAVVAGNASGYIGVMRLLAGTTTGVPLVELSAPALHVGLPIPNPSDRGAVLPLTLPAPAVVQISVLDVTGRLVRDLVHAAYEPGNHEIRWDGRDNDGIPVNGGIYFLRVQAGNDRRVERLTVVR